MRSTSKKTASALVGLVLLSVSSVALAQGIPQPQPVTHVASLAPGSILGIVQDERGLPVPGAIVSALGITTSVAVSDRTGRFELRTLTPGPYLVRAHLSGYVASRGQVIEVRSSSRSSSSIAMRRANPSPMPVVAAGLGPSGETAAQPDDGASTTDSSTDNHSEIAWRLRHA